MSEFSSTFKMNDHWRNYLIKTFDYRWNIAIGAYRSSKTFTNTLAFCLALENSRDDLHLVIASTVSSASTIVENYIKLYFANRYEDGKKYKGNQAGYVHTKYGTKIVVFLGGSMSSSYQVFRGYNAGLIMLEEANLLHENTLNEARGRNLMAKDPKFFVSFNPCSTKAKIYALVDELKQKGIANVDRSTIFDNPALTQERIQEIVAEFDPDTPFYHQFILGEDVEAGSLIYNVRDYNLIDTINPSDYLEYIVVCDQGESRSSSAFVLAALKYDNQKLQYCLDILKEYKFLNNAHNIQDQKMYKDTAHDLAEFVKECVEFMQKYPSYVLIDIDPEFYRNVELEFRHCGVQSNNIKYVLKTENAQRIKVGTNLLFKGKLRFNQSCKETLYDFKNALYDPDRITKKGEFVRLDEYDENGHLDMVDAVEYSFIWYQNKLYLN